MVSSSKSKTQEEESKKLKKGSKHWWASEPPISMSSSVGDSNSRIIGVLTSGGDCQGMNAAVRAVVRMGRLKGCQIFFIKEGYQGMINGGKNIEKATSAAVYGMIHKGGTVIGSSRCQEFRERPGRVKAALTLVQHKITNLVVIGGDGSLTGANLLRQEWPSILDELVSSGKISAEQKKECSNLNIVGMVGTIDNDFCGTEMTIGSDSGIHRIVESVDAIVTTAYSHQRTFILEVMGYRCGYLALVGALASGADWLFIPEDPPESDWPTKLCDKLKQERELGHRLNLIILSEGALDRNGQKITSQVVCDIVAKAGFEARYTVLGHVQRGGRTSAFDRVMASHLGAEAITTLLEAKPDSEPIVMGLLGGKVAKIPLKENVGKTKAVITAIESKNFEEAVKLRGKHFVRNLEIYRLLARLKTDMQQKHEYAVAVLQVGNPCAGMSAAIRSLVRTVIHNGGSVMAVIDGIDGLLADKVQNVGWADVNEWVGRVGSKLGSGFTPANKNNMPQIVKKLSEYKALIVIGGFHAFTTVCLLAKEKELKIPICLIPASIKNNVPGTNFSLGADTALNGITEICDRIRLCTRGTTGRVFIIELDTGFCGYLPLTAALSVGAERCYKFEDKITEKDVLDHAKKLKKLMERDNRNILIIMNSQSDSKTKNKFPALSATVFDIYAKEGKGVFTVEKEFISANIQQSTTVSPWDRIFGTKLGVKAGNWVHDMLQQKETTQKSRAVVVGLTGQSYSFQDVEQLSAKVDTEHHVVKDPWFLHYNSLIYDTL